MEEKWDASVTYEVKGTMTFRVKVDWIGEKPERVVQITALLQNAINQFTQANSAVPVVPSPQLVR